MFSPALINVTLSSRGNHTPYNMSVRSFSLCLFSCEHFPGCSDFSLRQTVGRRGCPRARYRSSGGGGTARVPLLGNFAPSAPRQPFRSRMPGGFWLGLCRSSCAPPAAGAVRSSRAVRCQPALPDCGTPVAPAGASVQGSAGALCSKPLLKTSAVTLIVGLPFLILSVRQQSAWRFVLSGLNLVNVVSKKLTKGAIL